MAYPCLTAEEKATVQLAEEKLRQWPQRLAMLPAVKPLSANWMPPASPTTGRGGTAHNVAPADAGIWWNWSANDPTRLRDCITGELLPDNFPFSNHAAYRCYMHALLDYEIKAVGAAYRLTADDRFARAIVDLLVKFSALYPHYPTTIEEDARGGILRTYGPEFQGTRYTVRGRAAWLDTEALQFWLHTYRLVRECPAITEAEDGAVRDLAREILEFESLPNFLYINDKYHNSLTNYYEAFVLASGLWGEKLQVRDTLSNQLYSGGDLAQLALNGPKGLRLFAANAFDRNGVYWELSPSYTEYTFTYIERVLQLLQGYSEPAGYVPGEAIAPFYRPLQNFDPGEALPHLWRAAVAQVRLALNNSLYVPTNDTNYLAAPEGNWLERWSALGKPLLKEEFPPKGSTLMPASGAATLRGPANRFNLHLDWHRMQDYHSHKDPLNLVASVDGYLVLSDLGYHLGHPLRHIVSERTAAHNTVTVDTTDSGDHGRGQLHSYLGEGDVQLVDASVPDAYRQCDLYRRSVVLVGDRYLIDIFRVRGGARHDYALLSRSDKSDTNAFLESQPGTLADPHREYTGWHGLDSSFTTPSSPYETMHDVRKATKQRPPFQVDWLQRDRPDLTTRVHHLPTGDAQIVLAKVPHQDRRAEMETRTDELMLVRRAGAPPLESQFVSVMEVLTGHTAALNSARAQPLISPDPTAVAVEISHEDGTDIVIHALSEGPHRLPAPLADCVLRGRFATIRLKRNKTAEITMLSGELSGSFGMLCAGPPAGARVAGIDAASGFVHLDRALPDAGSLAGSFVEIRGSTGHSEHWRILGATDEKTLELDLDHSCLLVMQGVVEAVENERTFWSGLNLCTVPEYGTPIRIGTPGDFSSPRYHLDYAQQTGLPLRVGGTTTNHEPRRFAFGLEKAAMLTKADIGKPFWVSGIEEGDYLFTQPVLRRTVNFPIH